MIVATAIPNGLCQCGCGQPTSLAKYTAKRDRMVKGQPMRFVAGHAHAHPKPVWPRFDGQVQKSDGCWLWTGHVNTWGYGNIRVNGRWALTHRLAWERANGPIPEGLSILHRCDDPRCVRPDHLYAGTQRENVRDQVERGRKRGMPNQPGRGVAQ